MNNLTEISRSFSFKLNIGDYQNVEFFCNQKKSCPLEEAEATSKALYEFCRKQVMGEVREFKRELKEPMQRAVDNILTKPNLTVEEWENIPPIEQALRQEIKKAKNRIDYHLKK